MSYVPLHLEWLDRQPAHPNGYPKFLSEESIIWLEERVKLFLKQCLHKNYTPSLCQVVRHWTRQSDRPHDLLFSINDALYGVTHRALLAVARPCWIVGHDLDLPARKPYTVTCNHLTANAGFSDPHPEHSIEFRLFDLDNVLYFSGLMSPELYVSEQVFLPLTEAQVWGCHRLECKNPKSGNWETI